MNKVLENLERELDNLSKIYNVSESSKNIISNNIELQEVVNVRTKKEPLKCAMNFIVLSKDKSSSVKPYNLIINTKNILKTIGASLLSGELFKLVEDKLLVLLFFCKNLLKNSSIKIDSIHTKVIVFLHEKQAYVTPIEEKVVINFIKSFTSEYSVDIINHLYELRVIDIENGKISLKERVVIRINL